MHVLVTGGAGFVGSHLCNHLLDRGDSVVCVDNLSTGRRENIELLKASSRPGQFEFVEHDLCEPLHLRRKIDAVAHLASPASPPDYLALPLQTLRVGSVGTEHALEIAREHGARFVLASTSEVYGDPAVHPQIESYWGNVNPIGPRSVYDEAKRYAEAVTTAYRHTHGVDTGIVRIFNTYGPRMRVRDGRVVSTFVAQALTGSPMTVFGDGHQTRSLCYVDDLVRALAAMLDADEPGPVNLGNPTELTVHEIAQLIHDMCDSTSVLTFEPLPVDDPTRRRPDITRAAEVLGWAPRVSVEDGLRSTIDWFATQVPDLDALAS